MDSNDNDWVFMMLDDDLFPIEEADDDVYRVQPEPDEAPRG